MNQVASTNFVQQAPRKERISRLAASLRHSIEQGDLEAGSWVPSVRELAKQYAVSRNTVLVALRQLEDEGLVAYQPRRGGVVKSRPNPHGPEYLNTRRIGIIMMARQHSGQDRNILNAARMKQVFGEHSWTGRTLIALQSSLIEAGFEPALIPFIYADPAAIDPETNPRIREWLRSLAGTVLMPGEATEPIIKAFEQAGRPYLTINRPSMYATHNFVSADHGQAGRLVGHLAVNLGLNRVLMLTNWNSFDRSSENVERAAGFMEVTTKCGDSPIQIRSLSLPNEEHHWRQLIEKELGVSPSQLVLTEHDLQADAAVRACRSLGMTVPDDVRVIGGTGFTLNDHNLAMSLAAVNQPLTRIGSTAGDTLAHMIQNGDSTIPGRLIPCTFEQGPTCPVAEALTVIATDTSAND